MLQAGIINSFFELLLLRVPYKSCLLYVSITHIQLCLENHIETCIMLVCKGGLRLLLAYIISCNKLNQNFPRSEKIHHINNQVFKKVLFICNICAYYMYIHGFRPVSYLLFLSEEHNFLHIFLLGYIKQERHCPERKRGTLSRKLPELDFLPPNAGHGPFHIRYQEKKAKYFKNYIYAHTHKCKKRETEILLF